jgi:hypothetical protein
MGRTLGVSPPRLPLPFTLARKIAGSLVIKPPNPIGSEGHFPKIKLQFSYVVRPDEVEV